MIIKETEALEFNCHYPEATHCAGSRCMAWRWRLDKMLVKDDDPDAPVLEYYTNVYSTTHGYCGLAGRP